MKLSSNNQSPLVTKIIRIFLALFGLFFALILFSSLMMGTPLFEAIIAITCGWIIYPQNMLSLITINLSAIIFGAFCFLLLIPGTYNFLSWLNRFNKEKLWQYSVALIIFILLLAVSGISSIAVLHQSGWLAKEGFQTFDLRQNLIFPMQKLFALKYQNEVYDKNKGFDFSKELDKTLFNLRNKWTGIFQLVYIECKDKNFHGVIAIPYPNSMFRKEDYCIHTWSSAGDLINHIRFYKTSPETIISSFSIGTVPKE